MGAWVINIMRYRHTKICKILLNSPLRSNYPAFKLGHFARNRNIQASVIQSKDRKSRTSNFNKKKNFDLTLMKETKNVH